MRSFWFRSGLGAIVFASVLLSAGAAQADDTGNDEVTLKTGATIRGTVLSEKGAVKILEAGKKKPRVIPKARVRSVERGKYATKPSGPAESSAPADTSPPAQETPTPSAAEPKGSADSKTTPELGSGPGIVKLHIDSPAPIEIYSHHDGEGHDLENPAFVCASPCDIQVDGSKGQEFSAAGIHANESSRFKLEGMSGDQNLKVSPGSPGLRTAGLFMVIAGSAAVAGGGVVAVAALVSNSTQTQTQANGATVSVTKDDSGLQTAGFVIAGVGVAALVGGVVSMIVSKTDAHVEHSDQGKTAEVKPRYWLGEF